MDEILLVRPDALTGFYVVERDLKATARSRDWWVPAGFSFDGASIPAPAWMVSYTPFDPVVMVPAVIHDWLYYTHSVERATADDVFSELLIKNGVPHAKAWAMYYAVRNFGGPAWENDDAALELLSMLFEANKLRPDVGKFGFPP